MVSLRAVVSVGGLPRLTGHSAPCHLHVKCYSIIALHMPTLNTAGSPIAGERWSERKSETETKKERERGIKERWKHKGLEMQGNEE